MMARLYTYEHFKLKKGGPLGFVCRNAVCLMVSAVRISL